MSSLDIFDNGKGPKDDSVLFAIAFDFNVSTTSPAAIRDHEAGTLPACLMRPTALQSSVRNTDEPDVRTYTEVAPARPHWNIPAYLFIRAQLGYDGPIYCTRPELGELVAWLDRHFDTIPGPGGDTSSWRGTTTHRGRVYSIEEFNAEDVKRMTKQEAAWDAMLAWGELPTEDQEGTSWRPR